MTIFRIIFEKNGHLSEINGHILLLYITFSKDDYMIFGTGYDYTEKIKIYFEQIRSRKIIK